MKNTMKISGIAGTIMFGFATLFKIQHWPLAGVYDGSRSIHTGIYLHAFCPGGSLERDP